MKIYAPLLFIALAAPLCAAVPNKITYQGRLSQNGIPSSGSKTFVACFKAGLTTVTPCESQVLTLPPSGDFTLVLTPPSSIDWLGSAVKLEISVDGVLLSPADDLSSVPYALTASTAAYAVVSSSALALSNPLSSGQVQLAGSASFLESWQSTATASLISAAKIDGSLPGQWTKSGGLLSYTGGNVGIGTASPASRLTLDGGFMEIRSGNDLMLRPAANDFDFRLRAVGTQLNVYAGNDPANARLSVGAAGLVGIGTSSPGYGLQVNHNDVSTGWVSMFRSTHPVNDGAVLLGSRADDKGAVQSVTAAGAAAALVMNPDGGNVGIGTTAPAAKLEVAGDAKITGGLKPDFDSGWFFVNTASPVTHTFAHNFGSMPSHAAIYTAASANPTWIRPSNLISAGVQYTSPEQLWLSINEVKASTCCNDYVIYCDVNNPCPGGETTSTTGYMKILLWK